MFSFALLALNNILSDINMTKSPSLNISFITNSFLFTCFTCDFYKYSTEGFTVFIQSEVFLLNHLIILILMKLLICLG